ncbi:MAG: EAL domain-containing protein [Pseudomonadota bacterium]
MSNPKDYKLRNLEDFSGIASDWFWETDKNHRFTYFSGRWREVTKLEPEDILGKRRDSIKALGRSQEEWDAHLADLEARRPFQNFEYMLKRPTDGSTLWVRVAGEPVFNDDGKFEGYRGAAHDITREMAQLQRLEAFNAELAERNKELDEARKALERNVYEDSLTGLLNRRSFEEDLAAALDAPESRTGLLHIDLDRFKWVNDTLGHPMGDAVLIAAADRISIVVGGHRKVYRVGGDEFMVILTDDFALEQVTIIGDSIIEAMQAPIEHEKKQATVGASVGIAIGKTGELTPAGLVANADVALYEAKKNGRNTFCQITPVMQERMQAHRRLASDIPLAIERCEFVPFFQPQVHVGTGAVVGAEALVRWFHPNLGLLQPGAFLDAAAELGVVGSIDRLMMQQALAAARRLRLKGLMLPSMSVNVSAARLMDPNLLDEVEEFWVERNCRLSIELLETICFDESQETPQFAENLNRLREIGVRTETDDFGSGRASITGLLQIRPDRLKIDRSLVQSAVTDPVRRGVVGAILDMTRGLGIEAMAEGVETTADIDAIRALGCNIFQGYAIAKPMSEADLAIYLAEKQPRARVAGE